MTVRVEQIPTRPDMGRSIIEHDSRSRGFPVRALLAPAPRVSKRWLRGNAYDQGQTSMCVAESAKGLVNTAPWSASVPYAVRSRYDVTDWYHGAQDNDEWGGHDYDGTSALGAMKYALIKGYITGYAWCFSLDDALDHLSQRGPIATGLNWHEQMESPDARGRISIGGDVIGGHETELNGIDVANREVIGTNSWGRGWGVNGRFRLGWDDLGTLLDDSGDAVTVTEVVAPGLGRGTGA